MVDVAAHTISMSETISESENLYLKASKEVDKWFLMGSPIPIIGIVALYLLFVTKIGPEYMKNRKPMNLRLLMLVYNLYQTIFNGMIVSKMFTTTGAITYLWKHCCHPIDPAINPFYQHLNETSWFFFFSKVMDLLDTVFFVLRKKQSHISFLHVYHHANMVLFSWVYLKYIKGEQGAFVGWLNALVHTIMYSYYFLSALGPHMQKYLWWKRYITKLQMTQFVIIIVYMTTLLIAKCEVPKTLTLLLFIQGVTFLILFTNFYIRSYVVKNKTTQQNGVHETDAKKVQ